MECFFSVMDFLKMGQRKVIFRLASCRVSYISCPKDDLTIELPLLILLQERKISRNKSDMRHSPRCKATCSSQFFSFFKCPPRRTQSPSRAGLAIPGEAYPESQLTLHLKTLIFIPQINEVGTRKGPETLIGNFSKHG